MIPNLLAWIYWDPPREAFRLPYFDHPIVWYGICFAFGFFLSYFCLYYLFSEMIRAKAPLHLLANQGGNQVSHLTRSLLDSLAWYIVIGTIVGARLGHVLFYDDWSYFSSHPLAILRVWEGGLASHGAAIGILIGLILFYMIRLRRQYPEISFMTFFDLFVIPVPLAGAFIRIGNFINQEIVGTPSSLPWAVLFGHPLEGVEAVPRHPVQLYEALAYFGIFFLLFSLWFFCRKSLKQGFLSGLGISLIFIFRFFLEFVKETQNSTLFEGFLQAGQYLSLPFILFGFIQLGLSFWRKKALI